MTLAEYYELPKGTNAALKYFINSEFWQDIIPKEGNLSGAFKYQSIQVLPTMMNCKPTSIKEFVYSANKLNSLHGLENVDTTNLTDMTDAFSNTNITNLWPLQTWDTKNVTTMKAAFRYTNIYDCSPIIYWNTSNVTDMSDLFYSCSKLKYFNVAWDTSNVTNMATMFQNCSNLKSVSAINCSSLISSSNTPIYYSFDNNNLTELGGFIDLKVSWTGNYGLKRLPNLTYESCINVLNGLYDFAGNGITPTSSQAKLTVHQNFLNLVGDEIAIGTNKGWTITV